MILRARNPQGSTSGYAELLNLKGFLWVNPLVPNREDPEIDRPDLPSDVIS
jgi:hypothetical protein